MVELGHRDKEIESHRHQNQLGRSDQQRVKDTTEEVSCVHYSRAEWEVMLLNFTKLE